MAKDVITKDELRKNVDFVRGKIFVAREQHLLTAEVSEAIISRLDDIKRFLK